MASRNLTKKFVELRNAAKASRSLGITKDEGDESGGESGLLKVGKLISHGWDTSFNFLLNILEK